MFNISLFKIIYIGISALSSVPFSIDVKIRKIYSQ